MSTPKLSERLRMMYIEARSKNPGGIEGFDTNVFFEAITFVETREAQVQGSSGQEGRPDLPSGEPVAWMTEGGRVISESDKVTAMRGTPKWQAKALRFSIPLYRSAPEVDAEAVVSIMCESLKRYGLDSSRGNVVVMYFADRLTRLLSGPSGLGEEKPVKG